MERKGSMKNLLNGVALSAVDFLFNTAMSATKGVKNAASVTSTATKSLVTQKQVAKKVFYESLIAIVTFDCYTCTCYFYSHF